MALIEDPLAHPRRAQLLHLVRSAPGVSFRGLVVRSGIPAGTCRHHLNILLRHGHLEEERIKKSQLALYPAGFTAQQRREALVRLDERMLAVRDAVATLDNPCQDDVQQALPMPRSTVQHILGRLVRMEALDVRAQGRYLRYSVPRAPRRDFSTRWSQEPAQVEA